MGSKGYSTGCSHSVSVSSFQGLGGCGVCRSAGPLPWWLMELTGSQCMVLSKLVLGKDMMREEEFFSFLGWASINCWRVWWYLASEVTSSRKTSVFLSKRKTLVRKGIHKAFWMGWGLEFEVYLFWEELMTVSKTSVGEFLNTYCEGVSLRSHFFYILDDCGLHTVKVIEKTQCLSDTKCDHCFKQRTTYFITWLQNCALDLEILSFSARNFRKTCLSWLDSSFEGAHYGISPTYCMTATWESLKHAMS